MNAIALQACKFIAVVIVSFVAILQTFGQEDILMARESDRVRGNHDAPVTLLEYSDFTCGFCEKFFMETWPLLFSEYVQTGKVRLIYRDFPRARSGPSVDSSIAARCAGDQGQYWNMHDRLFASHRKFSPGQLQQQAEELQLNVRQFKDCFDNGRHMDAIYQDRMEGGSLGIRGTPSFILYLTQEPEEGLSIPGAFPFDVFKEQIDRLLLKSASSTEADSGSL